MHLKPYLGEWAVYSLAVSAVAVCGLPSVVAQVANSPLR